MGVPLKKNCPRCKEEKDIECFSIDRQKKSGYSCYCKDCNKKYYTENFNATDGLYKKKVTERNKNRAKAIRQFVFNYLKIHPCACGESDPIVLEFDHLQDKEIEISKMVRDKKPIEIIQKEISKCQVLCANCHRRKTAKDFGWYKDLV